MYRCKRELRSDHFISASALALSKNDGEYDLQHGLLF